MSDFGRTLLYVGGGAWILLLVAFLFPMRWFHRFAIEQQIAAAPSRVWAIYDTNLNDPESRAFHEHVIKHEKTAGDPAIETALCEYSILGQRRQIVARYAVLLERPPDIICIRMLDIAGRQAPYGKRHLETTEFFPNVGGTRLAFTWEGETATLGQRFLMRRQYRKVFDRLKSICEGKSVAPMFKKQNPRIALVVSVLAIASFGFVFGWVFGLTLTLALIIHEFGHWLAMRLTGQPAPRVMLLPFLGGVTIANHPHKTLFNDAFCALMGAGFSALPALASLLLLVRLKSTAMGLDGAAFQSTSAVGLLATTALVLGATNLLQLLPFLPLDGGQVLRAIMQSFSTRWAKYILLAIGAAGMAGFAYLGELLFAGIVGIGMLQSWHLSAAPTAARPMSAIGLGAIIGALLMTAAIHAVTAAYGLTILRQLQS